MKIELNRHDEELLRFVFERALNALNNDISNYTPMTKTSDELRTKLVRMTNDLLALRGKLCVGF